MTLIGCAYCLQQAKRFHHLEFYCGDATVSAGRPLRFAL